MSLSNKTCCLFEALSGL